MSQIFRTDGAEHPTRPVNHASFGTWLCSSCGASYENAEDVPTKEYLDPRWGIRVFTKVPKRKFQEKEGLQRDIITTKNGQFAVVCATKWDKGLAEKYGSQ